jgi:hypothetical protein
MARNPFGLEMMVSQSLRAKNITATTPLAIAVAIAISVVAE